MGAGVEWHLQCREALAKQHKPQWHLKTADLLQATQSGSHWLSPDRRPPRRPTGSCCGW